MINKEKAVQQHLLEGGSLTKLESLTLFGLYNLGGLVYKMRRAGYNVVTHMVPHSTGKHAVYSVEGV
jgi:hypothetical protein